MAELDSSGTIQERYVVGDGADELLVDYTGSGTTTRRFAGLDERGSVISLTNSSGTLVGINAYDEYGKPAASNIGRMQYTGQMWLPEANLYYYKARNYAAQLGRFVQTDPIGISSGINLYAYTGNDPMNFVDPTGLVPAINCIGWPGCSIEFVGGGCAALVCTTYRNPIGPGSWREPAEPSCPIYWRACRDGDKGPVIRNPPPTQKTQTPWYKNSCVKDALKTGAKNAAIDALGPILKAAKLARTIGHQVGYKGIVADQYGSRTIRALGKTTGFENGAVGFSTGDWTSWVSAGITVLDFVPVVNEFTTAAALTWDAGVTAYRVYQCPK